MSSSLGSTRLQRVHRAIRFMENHLTAPITIADAADAACYSLYHFCRVFNGVAHHSPYEYLMRRRLTEAARRLVESRTKIIDIALDYQFNSPEAFSRAFRKMFALQPTRYRGGGSLDNRYTLGALSADHLDLMDRAPGLIPERLHLDGVSASGLMGLISTDRTAIGRLWEDLAGEFDSPAEDGLSPGGMFPYLGIVSFPAGWNSSGVYYMASIPRPQAEAAKPTLATRQLPAGTYARFRFAADPEQLQLILGYVFQTWLPKSGCESEIPFVVFSYGGKPWHEDVCQMEQQVIVPLL